jgi:hypothetical protein
MTPFDNIIGKTITSVVRHDMEEDYEYISPLGVLLVTAEQFGIYFGSLDSGVNIELMNYAELKEYSGEEYSESFLNEPRTDDELRLLINEQITAIEIAEYENDKLTGDNFVIKQGTYAGIRIRTNLNELTFYNESQGVIWMNMEMDIPNKNRWKWLKNKPQQNV